MEKVLVKGLKTTLNWMQVAQDTISLFPQL